MQIELKQRRNKFRERLRKQHLQGIIKHKRGLIVEYQLEQLNPVAALFEQLPKESALMELAAVLKGEILEHPMLCQIVEPHLNCVRATYQNLIRQKLEDETDNQEIQSNKLKAFIVVMVTIAGKNAMLTKTVTEFLNDRLMNELTKQNIFDHVFAVLRQLHFSVPVQVLDALESFVAGRNYWEELQLLWLVDVMVWEADQQPNDVISRIKQMYFNERVLTVIIDNMTSYPYSEPNELAGLLLFLLENLTYYSPEIAELLVRCGMLGRLKFYLMHSYPREKESCLRILENLCFEDEQRRCIRQAGFVSLVLNRLAFESSEIRPEMLFFICIYMEQLRNQTEADHFLEQDGLTVLIDNLDPDEFGTDDRLLDAIVAALRNLFQIGQDIAETSESNPYRITFEALGGIRQLERLASHKPVELLVQRLIEDRSE